MKQHLRHRLDAFFASRVFRRDGHRRFVVYGEGRCGSTLLVTLLDSHPQVTCANELLRDWTRYPRALLATEATNAPTTVFGFKLLKYHLIQIQTDPRPARFLPWLFKHQFQIILVTRRNLFRHALSKLNGQAKNQWHRTAHTDKRGALPITVSPRTLLNTMRSMERAEEGMRLLLGDLPHLHLVYEDSLEHASSWTETSGQICAFLDIPYASLSTTLCKFTPRDASALIENYDEVVHELSRSEYAHFLQGSEEEHAADRRPRTGRVLRATARDREAHDY